MKKKISMKKIRKIKKIRKRKYKKNNRRKKRRTCSNFDNIQFEDIDTSRFNENKFNIKIPSMFSEYQNSNTNTNLEFDKNIDISEEDRKNLLDTFEEISNKLIKDSYKIFN
jgi:chromatin segregation and condensation protein Rec8/ScpA/Scc1 (kleisin family)